MSTIPPKSSSGIGGLFLGLGMLTVGVVGGAVVTKWYINNQDATACPACPVCPASPVCPTIDDCPACPPCPDCDCISVPDFQNTYQWINTMMPNTKASFHLDWAKNISPTIDNMKLAGLMKILNATAVYYSENGINFWHGNFNLNPSPNPVNGLVLVNHVLNSQVLN